MSALYFFLQGIPECMGFIALSLAIAKVPLRWGYILAGGIIVSSISYVIRSLPFTFGLHLPVIIFLVFILIFRLTTTSAYKSIVATFFSLVALAVLEYFVSQAFFLISRMNPQQVIANEPLWSAIGVVQATILNIIALGVAYLLKPTEGMWRHELPEFQQETIK